MGDDPSRGGRMMRTALFVLQFATLGLALAFVFTRLWPDRFGAPAPQPPAASPESYRDAVARASPSVVNIYTRTLVAEPAYRVFGDPVMQRYSGITLVPQRMRQMRGLGSGVIVRGDGYLLTNAHVIRNAQDILVGLADGRVTPAQIVGADPETDLAVLRIEGSNFPVAPVADATAVLQVGDVVLAIGNPLGFGQTVTLGIVSATSRNQPNLSRFEDFIQTDAAINTGSSGGALVNARGDLVGINTAFADQGQGISFAIPAGAAMRVLEQIIAHGYVIRGWMGAEYATAAASASPVTDGAPRGVQIVAVLPGGPADRAGLRPGDVLRRFDGAEIAEEGDLRNAESQRAPGSTVTVDGERAGVPFKVDLTLIQRNPPQRG